MVVGLGFGSRQALTSLIKWKIIRERALVIQETVVSRRASGMALLGSNIANEVGLRLLLCPLGSNIVIRTACCSVGTVLPVYSTFKAIERKDQNEQQKWLMYWAVYGSFSLVEAFADKLISWVPMYYHMKLAFLVWLQLPSVDGAKQLYKDHLHPFFTRHQARIDFLLGSASGEVVRLISSHQAEIEYAKTLLSKIVAPGPAYPTSKSTSNLPGQDPAIEDQTLALSDSESDHSDSTTV